MTSEERWEQMERTMQFLLEQQVRMEANFATRELETAEREEREKAARAERDEREKAARDERENAAREREQEARGHENAAREREEEARGRERAARENFEARFAKTSEEIDRIIRVQSGMQDLVEILFDGQRTLDRKMAELAESQRHTDERLNALIQVVDGIVRRPPAV